MQREINVRQRNVSIKCLFLYFFFCGFLLRLWARFFSRFLSLFLSSFWPVPSMLTSFSNRLKTAWFLWSLYRIVMMLLQLFLLFFFFVICFCSVISVSLHLIGKCTENDVDSASGHPNSESNFKCLRNTLLNCQTTNGMDASQDWTTEHLIGRLCAFFFYPLR